MNDERSQVIYANHDQYLLIDAPDVWRAPGEIDGMVQLGDPHNMLTALLYSVSAEELARLLSGGDEKIIEPDQIRRWDDDHAIPMDLSGPGWFALIEAWAADRERRERDRDREGVTGR